MQRKRQFIICVLLQTIISKLWGGIRFYARWIVKFHNNLLELETSHSDLHEEFKKGCFSLKRTQKAFFRCPIDLTLEQTINADAASQRAGIQSMRNSVAARQKWAESHFLRTSVISLLFDDLGMVTKEEVARNLKHSQVKRNCKDLNKIINLIQETMNPFLPEIQKENLYNMDLGNLLPKKQKSSC